MHLNLTQMADSLINDIVAFAFVATAFQLQTLNLLQSTIAIVTRVPDLIRMPCTHYSSNFGFIFSVAQILLLAIRS